MPCNNVRFSCSAVCTTIESMSVYHKFRITINHFVYRFIQIIFFSLSHTHFLCVCVSSAPEQKITWMQINPNIKWLLYKRSERIDLLNIFGAAAAGDGVSWWQWQIRLTISIYLEAMAENSRTHSRIHSDSHSAREQTNFFASHFNDFRFRRSRVTPQ